MVCGELTFTVLPMFEAALAGEISYGQNMSVPASVRGVAPQPEGTAQAQDTGYTEARYTTLESVEAEHSSTLLRTTVRVIEKRSQLYTLSLPFCRSATVSATHERRSFSFC